MHASFPRTEGNMRWITESNKLRVHAASSEDRIRVEAIETVVFFVMFDITSGVRRSGSRSRVVFKKGWFSAGGLLCVCSFSIGPAKARSPLQESLASRVLEWAPTLAPIVDDN